MIRMQLSDEGFELSRKFLYASTLSRPLLDKRVRHFAARLEGRVKAKAHGRPGPRKVTGDYVRSINKEPVRGFRFTGWIIGSNAPQARRLELGFVGIDALGRVYDQPPYPHYGPAVDELQPEIEKGLDGFIDGLVRVVVA